MVRTIEASHRGEAGAPRAACAAVLELHRRGWPREAGAALGAIRTLGEVREEVADELGLILAPVNATAEKLRGLREGWVFWYVGHATHHP